jgi:hypothetical protein
MGIVELSRLVVHQHREVLQVLWNTVIRVDQVEIVLRVETQTMLQVEEEVLVELVGTLKLELAAAGQMVEVMVGMEYPFPIHLVTYMGKMGMSGVEVEVIYTGLIMHRELVVQVVVVMVVMIHLI